MVLRIVSQTIESFLYVCSPFAYVNFFLKLAFQKNTFFFKKCRSFVRENCCKKSLIKSLRYFQTLGEKCKIIRKIWSSKTHWKKLFIRKGERFGGEANSLILFRIALMRLGACLSKNLRMTFAHITIFNLLLKSF